MADLLIFPFGGNGREALMAIMAQNADVPTWKVLGFLDDAEEHRHGTCCGVPVLGGRQELSKYPDAQCLAVPGSPASFRTRQKLISSLELPSRRFATVIDPSSRIAGDARIGHNTLVMANVFVSMSAVVGDHCVILPNSVVSHDAEIGDHTVIGSNVSISGRCRIGRNCYVGSGTRIREGIRVGCQSLLGLGSNVVKDVADGTVVAGNPARPLQQR